MFFFMSSYLLFWNFFGDMIHEKFKKTEICSKNFIIFSSNLNHIFWPRKCWNLDFSISIKVVENWISLQKKSIPNQLEFWAASYGQNSKQVQKITQIQHYLQFSLKISNGDQYQICSSLSNRLIPSLSFRRKFFWKINWIEKQIHPVKIFKNAQKTLPFQQQFETHFWPRKCWNLVFSISEKVVDNWISFQKKPILNQLEFWAEI